MTKKQAGILESRRAGVLLHPSSLPGKQRLGSIGQEARNFLHFMKDSGLSVWQMLPLGPTHEDGSPYLCLSAHACNHELIDLDWLVQQHWLTPQELFENSFHANLKTACDRFFQHAEKSWNQRYYDYLGRTHYWLSDYALFMALKKAHNDKPWTEWPLPYRHRDAKALKQALHDHAEFIKTVQFCQFIFHVQWHELKQYATTLGIKIYGDMPIYVSMDSADVWAQRENFLIHKDGHCDFVAGVPPDAFSDQGQRWGNPLYDWDYLKQHDFRWWIDRFTSQLELFDIIRIDHFIGLVACWHIPSASETAIEGEWVKTPGRELLNTLYHHFDSLPLVAEDLGVITQHVEDLRDEFEIPGMRVLQFAFDGRMDNPYLPYNHQTNSVVYTGTHDNDTSVSWYQSLPDSSQKQLQNYIGRGESSVLDMPWDLNRMALASVANLAIIPMQDLLGLDGEHRMNKPGTTEGNWTWRFEWPQLWPQLAQDLHSLIRQYGRLVDPTHK